MSIEPSGCVFTDCYRRFHEHASALNVSADNLYTALLADAEEQSLEVGACSMSDLILAYFDSIHSATFPSRKLQRFSTKRMM
jgi:hypothetical protein